MTYQILRSDMRFRILRQNSGHHTVFLHHRPVFSAAQFGKEGPFPSVASFAIRDLQSGSSPIVYRKFEDLQ